MTNFDTLESQRVKILGLIYDVERRTPENKEGLQDLQKTYNGVVDSLNALNPISRQDPLDRLPAELFHTIIHETVTDFHRIFSQYLPDFDQVLSLTLVSMRWQDTILGMPLLWTCIHVNRRDHDFIAKIKTCIILSRDLPINLYFNLSLSDYGSTMELLSSHKSRIQGVSFGIFPYHLALLRSNIMKMIINILGQLHPLPNLTLFWWRGGGNPGTLPRLLLEQFSSLREISGVEIDIELLQTKHAHGLRKVVVPTNLETLMTVQDNLPALTHVHLPFHHSLSSTRSRSIESVSKDLKYLRWKHLVCRATVSPHTLQFLPRMGDLESLAIEVTFSSLGRLLLTLHQLSHLQALELLLTDHKQEPKILLSEIKVLPNYQVKSLNIVVPEWMVPAPWNLARFLPGVSAALLKAVPMVERLKATVPSGLDYPQLLEWGRFSRLLDISLTITHDSSFEAHYELPSSVCNVHLEAHPTIWDKFSSSSAHKLVTSDLGFSRSGSEVPCLHGSKWPTLAVLATSRQLSFESGTFIHLREFTLKLGYPPYNGAWYTGDDTTRFCQAFALQPKQLPGLKSLTFHGLPQWDILILMLKRRNINQMGRIERIDTLNLKAHCPIQLTDHIVSLLQGKYPLQISLYELSPHASFELIADRSVHGCMACLQCLRICTMPPLTGDGLEAGDRIGSDIVLQSYPVCEGDILSTWE
ncbi:hypothetical protein CPB86DRAFT_873316, partial [Serendipita vermifera]